MVFSFDEVKRVFDKTRVNKKLKDSYLPIACIDEGNDYVFVKVKGRNKGKVFIYLPNTKWEILIAESILDFFLLLNIGI